ncbi:MAG: DUF167 family protein [Thioalkalispiraceae bacterium]|jgi:uncharacterized protein (TIGR00251 family)
MSNNWYRWQGNDLILKVHVQAGARRDEVGEIFNGALKVRITAPPVDGKANKHLCAYLAKICKVKKAAVNIESGQSARNKSIRIQLAEQKLPDIFSK